MLGTHMMELEKGTVLGMGMGMGPEVEMEVGWLDEQG